MRLGILLLVVRVLADIATPHAPGAFLLDPYASVEAAGSAHHSIAVAVPGPPSRLMGASAVLRRAAEPRVKPRPTAPPRTFFARVLHPSESTTSLPASDDG